MEQKYYLPISSTSLAHYFGCACIKPSKFFDNKPEDLQDKFDEFLLITTYFGIRQTDCCLEIILTQQEIKDGRLIDVKNGFFLYDKPLPITRVKKIYFTDKALKEQVITGINLSTAFIPENLVKMVDKFEHPALDRIEKPQGVHINSYDKQNKTFNSLLGGFSLLKLAGEDYMNYSENYFASLSTFMDIDALSRNIKKQFKNLFDDSLYQKVRPFLYDKVEENIVENEAKKAGQEFTKNKITRIVDLSKLKGLPFVLAVFNSYGVGEESKKKKIDELILSNFHTNEITPDISEITALCYGLNRGYAVFNNFYNINDIKKEVKFRLNSQLDYYTIESLYQYAFNPQEKNNDFRYLDWCPRFNNTVKANNPNYLILDVIVVGKKKAKVLSKEYWANLLPSFLQSNKFFEKKLPELFQELGEVLYKDTKEEIENDFEVQLASKQEEIDKLKSEQKQLLQKNMSESKLYQHHEESISVVAESQPAYFTKNDVEKIVEQYLGYKEKGKLSLEKEAKAKGINITVNGKKLVMDEIILLLMTTPEKIREEISKDKGLFDNE